MKFMLLILKNLRRNPLRTALTTAAVVALIAIVAMITSVVFFLEETTHEKGTDVRLLISERYKFLQPLKLAETELLSKPGKLHSELCKIPGFDPDKYTIWHFVFLTLDPEMKDKELGFFGIATYPEKIGQMTEGMEGFDPRWIDLIRNPPRSRIPNSGLIMGAERMRRLGKKIGDYIKTKAISHRNGATQLPIEMEFEIVGEIPPGNRWNEASFIDFAYLNEILQANKNPDANSANFAWVMVDDLDAAHRVAAVIEKHMPNFKCETSATANSRFMEPLRDILWGIKYLLVPAILAVMTLILANTFSITVRERIGEIAVLKVLGFGNGRVMFLVLGESILVGALAGFLGAVLTFGIINIAFQGLQLPNFPILMMPRSLLLWGPALGGFAALLGSLAPALTARRVHVAVAFAQVT